MIQTIKVMLLPNNKQQTKMFEFANASRFAYNWAIGQEQKNYENGGKFLSDCDLRRQFTELKKTEKYAWLKGVSNDVTKQAIKDACGAFKRFFDKKANHPRFKCKRYSQPTFFQDTVKIQFSDTHVKLEKIANSNRKNRRKLNWIRLAEHGRVPQNVKYLNPRIKFDGLNWWLTVGIEVADNTETPTNDGLGVDIGIKDLAICSDGTIYPNINKTQKVKKIEKRRKRLQRSCSRKILQNKKGKVHVRTKNLIKKKRELLKVQHRLNNIRQNHIHQTTTDIVRRKPSYICIEDLNVSGLMKNRYLARAIQEQTWREFRRQIEYKAMWNNIEIVIANRFYPSSKLCSNCGFKMAEMPLEIREWTCPSCGATHNRDINAAINLKNYRDTDTLVGNLRLWRVQGPVSSESKSTLDEARMEHQSCL